MKKKLMYQKPAMQVIELRQTPQLLVGSGNGLSKRGYDPDDNNPFETNP